MLFRKLILFALGALVLSIKADGRFPLPEQFPETTFQLLLLPYSVVFVLIVVFFFKDDSRSGTSSVKPISLVQLAAAISIVYQLLICVILFRQDKEYSEFGYQLNRPAAVAITLLSIALLARLVRTKKSPEQFLLTTSIIFAGTCTLSILCFPLHSGRSDMLPLIQAAGKEFLAGSNPYTKYLLPHPVPLTYLPAMWMAYLPAVIFGFDLRFLHLLAVLSSMFIVYAVTSLKCRENVIPFCGLFLMIPYLQYRHEIYTGIFWLSLSLVFYSHMKNNPLVASVFLGVSAGVSQFAWVLIPVMLLKMNKQYGMKTTLTGFICCLVVACSIILPFALQSPDAFYQGVFGHWEGNLNVTAVNFSYFTSRIFSIPALKYFQIVLLFGIYLIAARDARPHQSTYEYMTYALMIFLLFNPLIWVYFYISLFVLMTFHVGIE